MYITSNNSATAAKYAQSVLSNPKIQLTEQQKSDVEIIVKKAQCAKIGNLYESSLTYFIYC